MANPQPLDPPSTRAARSLPATDEAPTRTSARESVTVVICAYTARRFRMLEAAVSAARDQLCDGDELLVVIDHNQELEDAAHAVLTDGSATVRLIPNRNARGLSGARNTGIGAARGELIVFLDDDAVPRPDWLVQLTAPFADPEVIGAGGVAAPAWEGRTPDWLPEEFLWVVGCSYRGLPQRPAEIRNPIGANMAFRRSVLTEAGGFTDGIGRVGGIPLGCEETEFSIRAARASGGRIVQQPAAVVDHVVPIDRVSLRYFLRRCWAEGISKALVSKLTGDDAALASERRYTTRTLPAGVGAGLREGLIVGDPTGFKRAAAIIVGLAVTVAGYLRGSATALQSRVRQPLA